MGTNEHPVHRLNVRAAQLTVILSEKELMLTTAESCTGGLLGKVFTDIAGSSAVYERGFITYANQAKIDMLGVERSQLLQHGAVSEEVAAAMASGAIQNSEAQVAMSTTGIAGPGGGTAEKPVGTVCFGWQVNGELHTSTQHFTGNRDQIRHEACIYVIKQTLQALA